MDGTDIAGTNSNATNHRTKEITHEDGTLAKGSVPAGLADLKQNVDSMAVAAGALVQPGIKRHVATSGV